MHYMKLKIDMKLSKLVDLYMFWFC